MVSAEIDLPPDGIAHEVTLDGHKITVYCRYRQEKPKKPDADNQPSGD